MEKSQQEESSIALIAKSKQGKWVQNKEGKVDKAEKKKLFKCYSCGKLGHFKKDCLKNKVSQTTRSDKSTGHAFISTNDETNSRDCWVIDSGASHHICHIFDWFSNYVKFSEPKALKLGDGRVMYAEGEGKINVEMLVSGEWKPGYLTNVWYVPGSDQNLFSAGSALDKGLVEYANNTLREFKTKSGETVAVGTRESSGIYRLLVRIPSISHAQLTVAQTNLQVWHERLGHQNKHHVQKFLKLKGIDVKLDQNNCEACIYGKMHRLSFSSRNNRPRECASQINADVCGPMPENSLGGARYYVVFKDDFSKFRTVYFLKNKSDVKDKLLEFISETKTVAGHNIKVLLTDGGTEFCNSDVKKILKANGIVHRVTMPYTPQQNGASEQENRTLVEAARTMLHAKNLPEKLWAEAVSTAAYVINRTGPSAEEGKCPFELWYKKTPSIDHIKIFGTDCYVHIPKQKRRKFDRKATKGQLVGYCSDKDGFRIWIPNSNEIILSRDVVFNENEEATSTVKFSSPEEENEEYVNINIKEEGQEVGEVEITKRNSIEENETNKYNLRNRDNLKKPMKYTDFAMFAIHGEPQTFSQAIASPEADKWKNAMQEELTALAVNKTWKLVDLPEGKKPIDNRWVFKIKGKPDENDCRYRARLVAKGYSQIPGIDYEETFSPVARWNTIRSLLSIAVKDKLKVAQFDIKTAFLYADIEDELYMKQPVGFDDGSGKVCRLLKSIYGLKQAPRCWNERFTSFLSSYNLSESAADPCLYLDSEGSIMIVLHVDDGLVIAKKDKDLYEFLKYLGKEFSITVEPANCFLGLQIHQLKNGSIFINQENYGLRVLERFNMCNSNHVSTPIERGQFLDDSPSEGLSERIPYREAIGSLLYLSVVSRPDLTYTVNVLSQVLENPLVKHWNMVKRVFKYLKGTLQLGILYDSNSNRELEAFSDADYAGDIATRRSTSGSVFKYCGGAIAWTSAKQRSVALSTTEAEFVAASEATKELIWLKRLFSEISDNQNVVLFIDNQSAIKLIKNPEFHNRSKHIDVRYKFVREKYQLGELNVNYINSENQEADLFTKVLPKTRFETLRNIIGVTIKPVF